MQNLVEQMALAQGRLSQIVEIAKQAAEVPVGTFEADDRSGSVRVLLAADGIPESIRLLPGWRNKCGTQGIGASVLDAAQQAMGKRMASWAKALEDSGVTQMMSTVDQPGAVPIRRVDQEIPFRTDVPDGQGTPRELSTIVEDALSLLESFDRSSGVGDVAQGFHSGGTSQTVSIVLTEHAMQSCAVDPRWAQGQDDSRIEAALRSALLEARQATATQSAGFRGRSSALVSELMTRISGGPDGSRRTSTSGGMY